jgi:hypothetical protein
MVTLSAIDNPYTSDVLEQCILRTDSIDFTCDSSKLRCKLCPKKFVTKKMKNHIGFHILHGDCGQHPHRCGYCGEVGCTIGLEITSGYGNKTAVVLSQIVVFILISVKGLKISS